MDQYDNTPGGTGTGGPANTPAFGSDKGAMRTAADHQIPDQTSPSHGASTGGLGGSSGGGLGGSSGGGLGGASAGGLGGGSSLGGTSTGGLGGSSASGGSGGGMGGSSTGGGTATQGSQATEQLRERAGEVAGRAEDRINQGMKQAADRIDTIAQRLDEMADQKLGGTGAQARAGQAAHSVADTMESVANYLRNNDTQALRSDLEQQMRERPLQTLMVAVAAGWLVGKILR